MIFYPLSMLMLAGIKDILIISTPQDLPNFERLLGDGSRYGINLQYKVQPSPDGLAQAFIIGEDFINGDSCAMILGDNIFYGAGMRKQLQEAAQATSGATVKTLGRGYSWLDTGTVDSLNDASEFVRVIQTRSGIEISALEEIAYRNNWISKEQLLESAKLYGKSPYGKHLRRVAEGQIQG